LKQILKEGKTLSLMTTPI